MMDKMIQLIRQAKIESVSFQSGDSEKDAARYYFSVDACQTEDPNDQHYLFMPESVESTIAGYTDGQPVMVNHHTWGLDGLGFGATVGGEYEDPEILITGYIALGFGTPSGPFTDTDQLAKAIEEGFVNAVSVHGKVLEAECSICGGDYNSRYYGRYYYDYNDSETCNHVRGFKYAVKQGDDEVLETCIVKIKKFQPQELSFVWNGSDDNAKVREGGIAMAALSGVPYDVEKRDWLLSASREKPNDESSSPDESSNSTDGGNETMADEVLQAKFDASEVKVQSLESQVGAKDTEIGSLKATVESLEKENGELKAAAQENERLIADGKIAREKAIALNIETFTKIYPDTKEGDLQILCNAQKESLETFSIEQIYKNTEGYQTQVDILYPEGRSTQGGADDGGDATSKKRPRPRRNQ